MTMWNLALKLHGGANLFFELIVISRCLVSLII